MIDQITMFSLDKGCVFSSLLEIIDRQPDDNKYSRTKNYTGFSGLKPNEMIIEKSARNMWRK
jgi:hypothetical protein